MKLLKKQIDGIEQLLNSALDAFSKKWWQSCVQHAEKMQDEDFTKEIMWAYVMDKIINRMEVSQRMKAKMKSGSAVARFLRSLGNTYQLYSVLHDPSNMPNP
jgi:hypothetical protein